MKINVKVKGTALTDNGKFRVYLKIDDNALTSMTFEENEIQNDNVFQSALKKKLKANELNGKEFAIET